MFAMRARVLLCVLFLASPMLLTQQPNSSPVAPAFDVATIKPHQGVLTMTGVMNTADGVNGSAATLAMLVQYAYELRSEDQVSGVAEWAKTDRFDVQARMGEADIAAMQKLDHADKNARLRQMMQALLAERFKLKVHGETKQVAVYDMVVAKGGSKLTDAASDTNEHLLKGKDGAPLHVLTWNTGKTVAQGYSAKDLADVLSQPYSALGRPVMDKTGLTGTYNFTLDWTPPHPGVRFGGESDSPAPEDTHSIFTALGDVGLKLQPSAGSMEMIVVDHAEKPTAD
jgi:uncharacterized protein (TIGR03435 family)